MRTHIARLARCNRAATAVEYGLVVSLIVLVLVAGVASLGGATADLWSGWGAKFVSAGPG